MAAGDGLVSMTPTSIEWSGTSAGINADGGVDMVGITQLSLNGVFTSDFDNYVIFGNAAQTPSGGGPLFYLRSGGIDTTGSDYTRQTLSGSSTSVSANRSTATFGLMAAWANTPSGSTYHIYGPALAQPTAMRLVSADANNSARIFDEADTHSLSVSYDGFTIIPAQSGDSWTGTVHVFGYEE